MADLSAFPITRRWTPQDPGKLQLFSFPTPNGVKASIMLEETGLDYEAHRVTLSDADVKSDAFLSLNPNNKIPAIIDPDGPGGTPLGLFESGAILQYLARKTGKLTGRTERERIEVDQWLMWQMGGVGPMAGQAHHFLKYAPGAGHDLPYAKDRYRAETARLYGVLDRRLADRDFVAGEVMTIADIAIWAWYGQLVLGRLYSAAEFLEVDSYKNVHRWATAIDARPAVTRGRMVNRAFGDDLSLQLHERHDASDFETRTQDKLAKD